MAKKRSPADSLGATDGRPAAPSESPESSVSRRDFLVRAGQYGWTLSLAAPFLGRSLLPRALGAAPPRSAPPLARALADGIVRTAPVSAPVNPALFSGLRWRMLGPFRGGRVDAVTGVPGRPNEFYFGAVNGGVWKSIDAGRVWAPVFDSQPVASIGALAVAPVGARHGLRRQRRIARSATPWATATGCTSPPMPARPGRTSASTTRSTSARSPCDPHNPNIVFVAAIGHLYAPNPERGVFRTQGRRQDLAEGAVQERRRRRGRGRRSIRPTPDVVYAGLWNTRRPPWFTYAPSNGPGGGIYKSTDGGTTWKQLTNGLPTQGHRPERHRGRAEPSEPRLRRDRRPRTADPAPRRAAGAPSGPVACRRIGAGRVLPLRRRRRARGPRCPATRRSGAAAGTSRRSRCDPRNPDIVYVSNVAVIAHRGRRQDLGRAARLAGRRRLPPGVDLARRLEHDDRRQRPGRHHHAQRARRRSARRDLELVAQPADRADLPRLGGLPVPVLGDRRAAGQRRRGGARRAASSPRSPRATGSRSAPAARAATRPAIRCIRASSSAAPAAASTSSSTHRCRARRRPRRPRRGAHRLDAAARVLRSRSARALLREPVPVQDHRRARRRGRGSAPTSRGPIPACRPPRRGRRGGHRSATATRGVIYTVAPSPLLVPMVWIGTDDGLIQVTTDDGKDVAERDAARAHAVEPRDDDRGVALRRSTPPTPASTGISSRTSSRTSTARATMGKTWQKITAGLPAGVYVHVGARKTRCARACCSPAPSAARSSRSTTATTGSRCSSTCRRRRCATSRSTATT